MADDQAHVLYRFYSATGQLLYVGITMNPSQRFRSHRDTKEWWRLVVGITVENYDTRDELQKAERRAIKVERPLHNIVHNGQQVPAPVQWPPPGRRATNCTTENPKGIVSHDISAWSKLPGWQTLTQAMNYVALQAGEAELRGGQDGFAEAVSHIARTICYMDCCPTCEKQLPDGEWVDTSVAPYRVRVEDGSMCGYYRCRNGHEWFCWQTLRIVELMG